MDPAVPDSLLEDSDGDGVPDVEEIKAHTDPHVADADEYATEAYRYQMHRPTATDGGINCYDFSVSNIRMVTTASRSSGDRGPEPHQGLLRRSPPG